MTFAGKYENLLSCEPLKVYSGKEVFVDDERSLNHTAWECKYHVVRIPKCRRKILYGKLRQYLGEILRELASQKESRIHEGHFQLKYSKLYGLSLDWLIVGKGGIQPGPLLC